VVASAPEPVATFTLARGGSSEIIVVFQPPSSSNGATITGYTVQVTGSPGTAQRTDCSPGASCTFTGRTNGAVQTVSVAATNKVGTTWSTTKTVVPYGTPSAPTSPYVASDSSYATTNIRARWATPSNTGGGAITYNYQWTAGISGSESTTNLYGSLRGGIGVGTYRFQVRACNPAGCSGYVSSANKVIYTPPPPPPPYLTMGTPYVSGSYTRAAITLHNYTGAGYQIQCVRKNVRGTIVTDTVDSTWTAAGNVTITCSWKNQPGDDFIWARNAATGDTSPSSYIH